MVGVVSAKSFFAPVWTYLRVQFLNQFPGGVASADAQGSPDFREGDVMSQQTGGTSQPPPPTYTEFPWLPLSPLTTSGGGVGAGMGGKASGT